jgi:integrase/recombinase XerD
MVGCGIGDLVVTGNTAGQAAGLPALVAGAGKEARTRFLEFFTVNIRNPNTRAAYSRAAVEFLRWCKERGIMDVSTVVGLRDRAIIGVMTYTFARVSAVVALNVEDYFLLNKCWWLRLHEKNGKLNEMPCHHKLEQFLDAYIQEAGIEADRKGLLFRAAIGKTKKLGSGGMSRKDVWCMVRRRATDVGIETPIGCHTFRATGITDYLTNGGRIEVAQRMAGHANAKTTGLYNRRNDDITVGEVERIGI